MIFGEGLEFVARVGGNKLGFMQSFNKNVDNFTKAYFNSVPGASKYLWLNNSERFARGMRNGIFQIPFTLLDINQALKKDYTLEDGTRVKNSQRTGKVIGSLAAGATALIPGVAEIYMAGQMLNLAGMVGGAMVQSSLYQKRNFYKPNLSPLYTQRAFKMQQDMMPRIMDSAKFVGNEARHMAARGA
jgi:hypothetical protein